MLEYSTMNSEVLTTELRTLLEMMGIKVKETKYIHDTDLDIHIFSARISGTDAPLFFDNNNELLKSVSFLIKLIFENKYYFFKNSIIDINGTEIEFIRFTKEKAELARERVEHFDKPYEFGYLNAYERMIVHSYMKRRKNIITESYGEGAERRLVVKKRDI